MRILKDAKENYPAWLEAIASAKSTIHFESYLIHGADTGRQFADALAGRARDGVRVRLIYDWFGAKGFGSHRLWSVLREAQVELRCFNPLRVDSPFGWLSRDRRKILFAVDSVPAIFAISREPFIVFTSNVFAILELRAMYFLLAGAIERFHLLT